MENKTKIGIAVGMTFGIVAILLAVYFLTDSATDMFIAFSIANVVLIGLVAVFVVHGIRESRKSGQPVQDEMTRKISHTAGYYSWLVTMYTVIGMMFVNILVEENGPYYVHIDRALPILVIGPGLVYILLMLRYKFKGIS